MLTEDSPDVSLVPVGARGGQTECIYLASTTDFFSPISLDPYSQGRIACANTLSDLYAIGAHRVDTILMILSVSTRMEESHRDIVTRKMIQGFNDACKEAGTRVTGGQTVFNPWPIIGGCATTTVTESDLVRADNLQVGDVLVLTKPLGCQVAANLALWLGDPFKWQKASMLIDVDTAVRAVKKAEAGMMRLNRMAAMLMSRYGAHGATDVTGFGLMGHASNLAAVQKSCVVLEIELLPIIKGLAALESGVDANYQLTRGFSAETSGGLLVALPGRAAAEQYIAALQAPEADGPDAEAWIVGQVVEGERTARLSENCTVLEV
ncbi:SelD [Symbiodinium pilosum]|uniref:SelD protein n=1 Tax=Symbiodinium pilosum TaxID=2952 RepID=A0A812S8I0_SYMPI|nr:SelD [Symbiodinium pilosum]